MLSNGRKSARSRYAPAIPGACASREWTGTTKKGTGTQVPSFTLKPTANNELPSRDRDYSDGGVMGPPSRCGRLPNPSSGTSVNDGSGVKSEAAGDCPIPDN